jgi:hypothetical protein
MTSGTFFRAAVCALALPMGAAVAPAQTIGGGTVPVAAPPVEVTPFISLGSGFSSRIGASIAFPVTQHLNVEAEVGYRRNEIAALSAIANLVYGLPRLGRVAPYLATGIGLEQYGVPTLGALIATPLGALTARNFDE